MQVNSGDTGLQDVSFNANALKAEGDLTFREELQGKSQQLWRGNLSFLSTASGLYHGGILACVHPCTSFRHIS